MDDAAALDDLLPARALGALDGEDLAALDAALVDAAGHAGLAARADSWAREIDALAGLAPPVVPSEMVRRRVLQLVARSAPERPEQAAVSPARSAPIPWWLGAAAAGLLALVGWGVLDRAVQRGEIAALRSSDQALSRSLAAVRQELGSANGEIVRLRTESRVVSAPDMHPVVLAGLESAPSSSGRTFVSPRDGKALFYAYGLPALPAGKQYQLWFIAEGKPVSGGVFDVDAAGNGALLVDHVAPVDSIQAWAVTLEPAGGLPAPSGAMVLKG